MRNALRLSVVAGIAVALVGCGSGAKLGGGKEGAAAALFTATGPTKSSGSLLSLAGQGIDVRADLTVTCEFGGKATLKGFSMSTTAGQGGANVATSYTVAYDGCVAGTHDNPATPNVEKEHVVLNGSLTVTQTVDVAGVSGKVSQTLKGKVTFGGAFDDYLDADITQSVDWSKLGSGAGSVTVALNGSLKTSSDSFTYTNESITVTAGVMIAAQKP